MGIGEQEYSKYQENIREFLANPKAMEFDTTTYVSTIIHRILQDLNHG